MFNERRAKVDIYADILKILSKKPKKPTPLAGEANINYDSAEEYVETLIGADLVEKEGEFYTISEKGKKFVELYESLEELVSKSSLRR